jgi:hypothetical protein
MKKLKLLGLGAAVALVFAAGVSSAKPLNWTGTTRIGIGPIPDVAVTGGGVATVNTPQPAANGPISVKLAASRGGVTGTGTAIVTDPNVINSGIAAVIVQFQPRTGTLFKPGQLTHKLPVGGVAKICLLSTVCTDFLPLLLTQPTTNGARYQLNTATANQLTPGALQGKKLGVPGTGIKGLGVGGMLTVGGFSAIRISIEAAPWTLKTATAIDQTDANTGTMAFHNKTQMGFAHGPASGTTSTAQPSGVLQVVTPAQVRTNLALGSNKKISVITNLIVHFVPEPGMLLLLGSGVVGLALLGRNRMRK